MRHLKIGMLSFAHSHAFSYYRQLSLMENVQVTAIADPDFGRVRRIVEEDRISYYEDYRQLLERADVEAVIICSENARHAEMVGAAAVSGKHVLCEKPLGVSVTEMKEMIAQCSKHGVQLMTAFPCRYLPAVQETKRALENGEIGDVLAVKGFNRGTMPGGWFVDPSMSGGGAIMDHTVHIMDLIRWMLGQEPVRVYAESGTLFHDIPVEDAGLVHVSLTEGLTAVIDTSWSRTKAFPYWGDIRLEITGTQGVIQVDALAQVNEVYSDAAGQARWSYWGDSMDRFMLEDFAACLLEGSEVPVNGEDGMRSAAVALAAYDSIRLRKTVDVE